MWKQLCRGKRLLCTAAGLGPHPHLRHGVQQQHHLAPGSIDFIPFHVFLGGPAQPEARDGAEGPIVPDTEHIIIHIRVLQPLQLRLLLGRSSQPHNHCQGLIVGVTIMHLVQPMAVAWVQL